MGTNYYTNDGVHIGKRSAAGKYCHRCRQTLVVGGKHNLHDHKADWHHACPTCGYPAELLNACMSFTWAMDPKEFVTIHWDHFTTQFKDEYGNIFRKDDFIAQVLEGCTYHFHHLIGKEFS